MSPDQPRESNGRFSSDGSVSLRDHVDALLQAAKELQSEKWDGHEEAHELIAAALSHQEVEAAEWRKASNEWRGTVGDISARFVTRQTLDDTLKPFVTRQTLDDTLKPFVTRQTLDDTLKTLAGDAKKDRQVLTTQIIAMSGVAVGLAVLISRLLGAA